MRPARCGIPENAQILVGVLDLATQIGPFVLGGLADTGQSDLEQAMRVSGHPPRGISSAATNPTVTRPSAQ